MRDAGDRLDDDERDEQQQRERVDERREHFRACVAVRGARRWRPARDPLREQCESQRGRVGGHVPGVRQQRERAGQPPADCFDDRKASGQRKCRTQRAQRRRIGGDGMVVRIAVVRVQGMVVGMRGTHQKLVRAVFTSAGGRHAGRRPPDR